MNLIEPQTFVLEWQCNFCNHQFKSELTPARGSISKDLDHIHNLLADGGLYEMHHCFGDNTILGECRLLFIRMGESKENEGATEPSINSNKTPPVPGVQEAIAIIRNFINQLEFGILINPSISWHADVERDYAKEKESDSRWAIWKYAGPVRINLTAQWDLKRSNPDLKKSE